jgi:hypothetical protein
MSSPMTIACAFHIDRRGKGRQKISTLPRFTIGHACMAWGGISPPSALINPFLFEFKSSSSNNFWTSKMVSGGIGMWHRDQSRQGAFSGIFAPSGRLKEWTNSPPSQ